jgi:hypothetical protein
MIRVPENMVIPSGWHYIQNGVRIEAPTKNELIEKITQYRSDQRMPVGNPLEDFENYVCQTFPMFCSGEGVKPVVVSSAQELKDQMSQWISNVLKKKQDVVDDTTAAKRAKVCIDCSKNIPWKSGCAPCIRNIENGGLIARHGRDLPLSGKHLHACSVCKHDNKTAVWLKNIKDYSNVEATPDWCWMRK